MLKALFRRSYYAPTLTRRWFNELTSLFDIDSIPKLEKIDAGTHFYELDAEKHANRIFELTKKTFAGQYMNDFDKDVQDKILMTRSRINFVNRVVSTKKDNSSKIYILTSPPGTGKSTILFALANEMIKHGWLIVYIPECEPLLKFTEYCALDLLHKQRELFGKLKITDKENIIKKFWDNFESDIKKHSPSFLLVRYLMIIKGQTDVPVLIMIDQFNQLIHEEVKLPVNPDELSLIHFLKSFAALKVQKGAVIYGVSTYESMKLHAELKSNKINMLHSFPSLSLVETKLFIDLINQCGQMKNRQIVDLEIIEKIHEETSGLIRPLITAANNFTKFEQVNNPSEEFFKEVVNVMERHAIERMNSALKHIQLQKAEMEIALREIKGFTFGKIKLEECYWLNSVGVIIPSSYRIPQSVINAIKKVGWKASIQDDLRKFVDILPGGLKFEKLVLQSVVKGTKLRLPIARGSDPNNIKEYNVQDVVDLPEIINPNKPSSIKIKKFTFMKCFPGQDVIDAIFYAEKDIFFFQISTKNYSDWIRDHEHQFKGLAAGVCGRDIYEWVLNAIENKGEFPAQPDVIHLPEIIIKATRTRPVFPKEFTSQVHFIHLTNSAKQTVMKIHEKEILTIQGEFALNKAGLLNENA